MPAPHGNQFWKARSTHGRKPIFAEPDDLWLACEEYFQWVEDHPLLAAEAVKFQGKATLTEIPKMRAMTIAGLCIFLDINQDTWFEYCKRDGFSEVTTQVDQIIRTQKFQGAAAELLNPNIIARDLGLADKSELTGRGGGPIETKELSESESARRVAFLLENHRRKGGGEDSGAGDGAAEVDAESWPAD